MKRGDLSKYPVGSAAYVVAHARRQRQRGKGPSLSFKGITNPVKALETASKLVSPCCIAKIWVTRADGVMVGTCCECYKYVTRMNPVTGQLEWLDGHSPWTTVKLRPQTSISRRHRRQRHRFVRRAGRIVLAPV